MKTKFDDLWKKYYVVKPHFKAKWAHPALFYFPLFLAILTFFWPEPFFDFVVWSRLYHFSPVKFFDNGARILELSLQFIPKTKMLFACICLAFSGFALYALYFGGYELNIRDMRSWARDSSETLRLYHAAFAAHSLLFMTASAVPLMLLVSFKIIRQWTLGVDHEGRPLGPDK